MNLKISELEDKGKEDEEKIHKLTQRGVEDNR